MCTALNVLRTVALTGRPLADLAADLTTYPQVLLNVRVRERVDLDTVPAIAAAMARVESRLEGEGRLLVRYSGTEPLLRVMIEGKHQDEIQAWAKEIVDVVKEHLGSMRANAPERRRQASCSRMPSALMLSCSHAPLLGP